MRLDFNVLTWFLNRRFQPCSLPINPPVVSFYDRLISLLGNFVYLY
jgi:hypothetical protein